MSNPINTKPIVGGKKVNWNSNMSNIRSSMVLKLQKKRVGNINTPSFKQPVKRIQASRILEKKPIVNVIPHQNYIVETGVKHNGFMLKYRIDENLNCHVVQ